MEAGSYFQSVYGIVARIPRGKVATYGQIAWMLGTPRKARIVGYAMRAAGGEGLPCHRVVNKAGELAPEHVFGDKRFQRSALEAEGITFLPDGRIDMKKHLWSGEDEDQP